MRRVLFLDNSSKTYHNLVRFLQSKLEGILEGLDNDSHALRRQREPGRFGTQSPSCYMRSHRLTRSRICGGGRP
jgi:hypothetical protein